MLKQYRSMHWYEMFRDGCIAMNCSVDTFSNSTELLHLVGSIFQKSVGCARFLIELCDDLRAHASTHLLCHPWWSFMKVWCLLSSLRIRGCYALSFSLAVQIYSYVLHIGSAKVMVHVIQGRWLVGFYLFFATNNYIACWVIVDCKKIMLFCVSISSSVKKGITILLC